MSWWLVPTVVIAILAFEGLVAAATATNRGRRKLAGVLQRKRDRKKAREEWQWPTPPDTSN